MVKILVVDDDVAWRDFLKELLGLYGHEVVIAPEGESGWRIYQECLPGLVITDRTMPRLDGEALARLVLESGHETPVIMITGDRVQLPIQGVSALLMKPCPVSVLMATVNQVLASPA